MITYEQRKSALANALNIDVNLITESGHNMFEIRDAIDRRKPLIEYSVMTYEEAIEATASILEEMYEESGWIFDGYSAYHYVDSEELEDKLYYEKEGDVESMTKEELLDTAMEYGLIDDEIDDIDNIDIDDIKDDLINELINIEDILFMTEEWSRYGELETIDFEKLARDVTDEYGIGHELSDNEPLELENGLYAFGL